MPGYTLPYVRMSDHTHIMFMICVWVQFFWSHLTFDVLCVVCVDTPYHVHAGLPGVPNYAEHL